MSRDVTVHSLCASLVVPEWYVPHGKRKLLAEAAEQRKAQIQSELAVQKAREEALTNDPASRSGWFCSYHHDPPIDIHDLYAPRQVNRCSFPGAVPTDNQQIRGHAKHFRHHLRSP